MFAYEFYEKFQNSFFNSICSEADLGIAATSKMERFVIIVNGFQPLTIITKHSILHVGAALDPPLFEQLFLKFDNLYL